MPQLNVGTFHIYNSMPCFKGYLFFCYSDSGGDSEPGDLPPGRVLPMSGQVPAGAVDEGLQRVQGVQPVLGFAVWPWSTLLHRSQAGRAGLTSAYHSSKSFFFAKKTMFLLFFYLFLFTLPRASTYHHSEIIDSVIIKQI